MLTSSGSDSAPYMDASPAKDAAVSRGKSIGCWPLPALHTGERGEGRGPPSSPGRGERGEGRPLPPPWGGVKGETCATIRYYVAVGGRLTRSASDGRSGC